MTTALTDIMPHLKQETAGLHQQTEQLMHTGKLMAGSLSLAEYAHLLAIQTVFHRSLEQAVGHNDSFFSDFDWQSRQKTNWLLADLQQLNQPIPSVDDTLFAHLTGYQLLGAMYVAEGSMLGGRVIAKALARTPALCQAPIRFYTGYGDLTGPYWKAFGAYLTHRAPSHEADILAGAIRAFNSLIRVGQQTERIEC
ncbi:biliverdin-producing heme oxygenase [Fibrella aquatilis]|uniref:Biliverdin-producing heme oxygenase n=1 Tax=Fibrella aquatilis TaxID=2817059 RepID=A0A939GA98_9BACT|nr:biliverdin-producing heme oxygenase [Fibrella aquatilis]MBO0934696.1 biliverdin-producing heme oxygenase [Fibrella aquatilis]